MISILVFLLLLAASPQPQQPPSDKSRPKVHRLCGKLVHSEYLPVGGDSHYSQGKTSPLRKATLELYRRQENSECCRDLSIVAQAKSGHWGDFKFRRAIPGEYWLVAHVGTREYRMPIHYEPHRKDPTLCSSLLWEVNDSGEFTVGETITVN
jgi:hypothetical protein